MTATLVPSMLETTESMVGAPALVPAAVDTAELATEHTSAPFQFFATTYHT